MEMEARNTLGRFGVWASFVVTGILTLALVGPAAGQGPTDSQATNESPLDVPLRLISRARASYEQGGTITPACS